MPKPLPSASGALILTDFLAKIPDASGKWVLAEWLVSDGASIDSGVPVVSVKSMERDLSIDLEAKETGILTHSVPQGQFFEPGDSLGSVRLNPERGGEVTLPKPSQVALDAMFGAIAEPLSNNTKVVEVEDEVRKRERSIADDLETSESPIVKEDNVDLRSAHVISLSIMLTGTFLGAVVMTHSKLGVFLSVVLFLIVLCLLFKYWAGLCLISRLKTYLNRE